MFNTLMDTRATTLESLSPTISVLSNASALELIKFPLPPQSTEPPNILEQNPQPPIQAIIKPHTMKSISKLVIIAIIYLLCFVDASSDLIPRLEALNRKREALTKEMMHEHEPHTAGAFDKTLVERIEIISQETAKLLEKAKLGVEIAMILMEATSPAQEVPEEEWEWKQWQWEQWEKAARSAEAEGRMQRV